MCRLFGMTGGQREVQATFWLLDAPASLILLSESQPDGVGIGTFDGEGSPSIWRKPVAANRSETFIALAGSHDVRSRTFLAHIRHATEAEPNMENTHPFEQNGRIFAHNGVVGDLPEIRRRLGDYTKLIRGGTDSEHYFTLITKRIDEHGGDVSAGITAAARELAAELALYSLNMLITTQTDIWALRYPESNELWILERSLGGMEPVGGFDERSASGILRVHSGELSVLPATVIASERMDSSPGWRLLESGELVHVDADLNVTSTTAVPDPPANMIDLQEMSAEAAASQAEGPADAPAA
jgi:predicted glutamine amidotransferase